MVTPLSIFVSENREPSAPGLALQEALLQGLATRPAVELTVIPHLYDLTADGVPLSQIKQVEGDLVLFCWLYPRAAFWVLDAHDIAGRMGRTAFLPDEEMETMPASRNGAGGRSVWCFDLREQTKAGPYLAEVDRILEETGRLPAEVELPSPPAAAPRHVVETAAARWYPVIDFSRCENCQECLNFCLFGVYGIDAAGHVFVESPDNCRNGCPACARVCGKRAIIFPHHSHPAIAGNGHDLEMTLRPDVSNLLSLPVLPDVAHRERDEALRSIKLRPPAHPPADTPRNALTDDSLDRLVDDVDEMDL